MRKFTMSKSLFFELLILLVLGAEFFVFLLFLFYFEIINFPFGQKLKAELIKKDLPLVAGQQDTRLTKGSNQETIVSSSTKVIQTQNQLFLRDFTQIKEELLSNSEDFSEVNLEKMEVRIYKSGVFQSAMPILKRGEVETWGGTAAGLYKILSKTRIGFSVVAKVYMPYSLGFYGKYYLHGEPYESPKKEYISDSSGGCVQLANENAKLVFNAVQIGTKVLVIDKQNDGYVYDSQLKRTFPQISAKSFLVADLDSGFALAEKNSQEKLPIASLTKLMTALVVSENVDLRKTIEVKKEMLNGFGTSTIVEEGKRLSVIELFYPLLVESSNDAANALSYFLGKIRIIDLMNEKAKAILMKNTNFTDTSGYDPGNVSTAQDLFYLARYIRNNRFPLLEITKSKPVRNFGLVNFEPQALWNKNVFVNDPGFVGGKTGFIKDSLYTGVFIFRFYDKVNKGRDIVIILLGSPTMGSNKTDVQKIYQWLRDNYFV